MYPQIYRLYKTKVTKVKKTTLNCSFGDASLIQENIKRNQNTPPTYCFQNNIHDLMGN